VKNALRMIDGMGLDLLILLDTLFWGEEMLVNDHVARFARACLMHSEELLQILKKWRHPPRTHGRGIRMKVACLAMESWALDTMKEKVSRETKDIGPLLHVYSPCSVLSEEHFTSFSICELAAKFKNLNTGAGWAMANP
ncbi:hypothetical protein M422DRAFT_196457, partial [Sphaerobolus stellatus SS14]